MHKCFISISVVILTILGAPYLHAQKDAMGKGFYDVDSLEWVTEKVVRNEDLLGKITVLHFWSTWCSPCIQHLPTVKRQTTQFGSSVQTIMVAWATEPSDSVKAFANRMQIDALWCIDPHNHMLYNHYNAHNIPHAVVHNIFGKVVWEGNGLELTDDILETIIKTGVPPEELSEEERTSFQLKVVRALPSDKNVTGTETFNGHYKLFAQGFPPDLIIHRAAAGLGLKHLKPVMQGEWKGATYNVELSIDSTFIDDQSRNLILQQLAKMMRVTIDLSYERRELTELKVSDQSKLDAIVSRDLEASTATTTNSQSQVMTSDRTRVQTLISLIKHHHGGEYDLSKDLSRTYVRCIFPFGDRDAAFKWFTDHGINVSSSIKSLPTLVTRYPDVK